MTTDEIVRALRVCTRAELFKGGDCYNCPAVGSKHCITETMIGAADLIERMTAEAADLRKEIEWKDMVIALAQRKQAEAEAERDALREKVPQWVTVKDVSKLPQDHLKRYLIAFKDAGGAIVDMARHIPGDGWRCDNWDVQQGLITHWMPLPKAPEEGEKA